VQTHFWLCLRCWTVAPADAIGPANELVPGVPVMTPRYGGWHATTVVAMKVYTRTGDDGTTGLFFGGRVRKDDPAPTAYGDVDEAQACIGLARAETVRGSELDTLLVNIARDLWVLMAELATAEENRSKLVPEKSLVTESMVVVLEQHIDSVSARFTLPAEFVVPGQNRTSALLDVARTVVRRAERHALVVVAPTSLAVTYLNRLSDLLWTLARWQDGNDSLTARS
jgi:cob(I)alamin adenosyltransferase